MKKILLGLIVVCSVVFAQPYTDMLGRLVDVTSAQKLVFLGPGALRMGVYLGLEERLVGIEKTENDASLLSPYRTFLGKERIAKLPIIGIGGPGKMPDFEALVVHKPDLIIASFLDKNQLDLITQKTGIPVLALSYGASYGGTAKQLLSMKNSLLLLGKITQTLGRAETLTSFITQYEEKLSKLNVPHKRVYVGGLGYKGVQGMNSTEANYPPFEMLGLQNTLFEDKETMGHHFVDFEALLRVNPEMIFIDMFGKAKIAQEYAAQKPLFDTLNAYKTGNVKEVLGYNFYSTNIENLLVISYQIAFYMGASVDVNREAKTIYEAFYGKNGATLLEQLSYGLK